ncbi:MAG: HD domain-containing protein [Promethearchaeota archaeon]
MREDMEAELARRVHTLLSATRDEEATYRWEELYLHASAAKSLGMEDTRASPGDRPMDRYRTPFQHDRDRIIHSKAFRRLAHKTQIYIAPEGDHFRTRLTHTLEVAQLARTAARALRLNEDLVEAIALGHDLGHPPFGHGGERALAAALDPVPFDHHEQSYRVVTTLGLVDKLPLNLTEPARWGIRRSSWHAERAPEEPEETEEERLVRYVDDIAWVNHDIDDAIVAGILSHSDLGVALLKRVGRDRRQRLNHMLSSLIESSRESLASDGMVIPSAELEEELDELRAMAKEKVWNHPSVERRTEAGHKCLLDLFKHFEEHSEDLPAPTLRRLARGHDLRDVLRDHLCGMTDRYAIRKYRQFYGPETPLLGPEASRAPSHACEGYRRVLKGPGRAVGERVTLDFGQRHGALVGVEYRVSYYLQYGEQPSRCDIDDVVGRVKIISVCADSCEAEVVAVDDPERPITKGCVVLRD